MLQTQLHAVYLYTHQLKFAIMLDFDQHALLALPLCEQNAPMHLSVLQAMEIWAGPGNKAALFYQKMLYTRHQY